MMMTQSQLLSKSKKKKRLSWLIGMMCLLILSSLDGWSIKSKRNMSIEDKFEVSFEQWVTAINQNKTLSVSSNISHYTRLPEFKPIIDLGITGVPCMVKKIKEMRGHLYSACLVDAIIDITKTNLMMPITRQPLYRRYILWWDLERYKTDQRFDSLYKERKEISPEKKNKKKFTIGTNEFIKHFGSAEDSVFQWMDMPEGPEKERLRPFQKTTYQQLLDLGIAALPHAIEKIREGDTDLIAAINYWTDNALQKSADASGVAADDMSEYCLKWWKANKANWLLPPIEKQDKE